MSTTRLFSICLPASIPNLRHPGIASRQVIIDSLRHCLRDLLDISILRHRLRNLLDISISRDLCSLMYDRSNGSRNRLLRMLHLVFYLLQDFRVFLECCHVALERGCTVYHGNEQRHDCKKETKSGTSATGVIIILGLGGFGGGVVGECFMSLSDVDGGGLIGEL